MKSIVLLVVGTVLAVAGLDSFIRAWDRLASGDYLSRRFERANRLRGDSYISESVLLGVAFASLATYAVGVLCLIVSALSLTAQAYKYLRGD
jgi:hypothetical protein